MSAEYQCHKQQPSQHGQLLVLSLYMRGFVKGKRSVTNPTTPANAAALTKPEEKNP